MLKTTWQKPVAAVAAGFLMVAPAYVATDTPHATADEVCQFSWGIKQSFRSYINGKIANGGWGANGIGFTGSKTGSDGAFVFTPDEAEISGDTVTVPLQGTLKFEGHGGKLDMTLSDFKVVVSGNTGQIVVDYVSYESDMNSNSPKGDEISADNVPIADISLKNRVDTSAGSVNLSGTTTLTTGGHNLFLSYDPGTAMDPTSGSASLGSGCDGSGGSGSGGRELNSITGTFTGFNKQAMAILSETNDTMNGITTFMGNTQDFLDEYESFQKRGAGGTSGSNSGNNSTSQANGSGDSGSGTGEGGAASGAAYSPGVSLDGGDTGTSGQQGAGGNANGASNGAGSSGGNEQCDAAGVTSTSAAWGVKKSFQSYITGSIAKGRWQLSGVGYEGGRFKFSGNQGSVDTSNKQGSLRYGGSMHFTGHQGTLDLNISNLEVVFKGNSGELVANVVSSNMDGQKKDFGRTVLGTLAFNSLNVSNTSVGGEARVVLTQAGAQAFADFYEPGTELDPLSFTAQLGGTGDCNAVGGTGANGGATGTGGQGAAGGELSAGGVNAAQVDAAGDSAGDSDSQGYEDGKGNFKIKSAAAKSGAGEDQDAMTYLLLLIAGLVIAGGSTARLVMNNPA